MTTPTSASSTGGPGTIADALAMAAAWWPALFAWSPDGSGIAKNPQEEPIRARTPTPARWVRLSRSSTPSWALRLSVVTSMARASA